MTIELPSETIWLRRPGNSLADVLNMQFGQCFNWHSPAGTSITWSIDMALRIIGEREPMPEAALSPELVVHALRCNSLAHELDKDYALTTDLTKPLIATISPLEKQDGKIVLIIIDGWHRILHAFLVNYPMDLQVHVLTPEEEQACRIERIA